MNTAESIYKEARDLLVFEAQTESLLGITAMTGLVFVDTNAVLFIQL